VNMAQGRIVNKRLAFNTSDEEEDVNMSDTFSPCRTRSGIVYEPKSGVASSASSESEYDIIDSEDESVTKDYLPLLEFDDQLSPIRTQRSKHFPRMNSPAFLIKKRERTSTRVVQKTPKEKANPSNLKCKRSNINPYESPAHKVHRKRHHSSSSFSSASSACDSDDSGRFSPLPEKKLRVSELSISRYEEEFLELSEVASGEFGSVRLARHRLDGSDYAVKVNKNKLRPGSYEEKKALNEVFAHATLSNHKHIVRYYNSWVEEGKVFIQNEFCEKGSLSDKIEEKRISGQRFSEMELKKILKHTLKGLHYIHSKQMAHLDIKPENILISVDQETVNEQDFGVYVSEEDSDDECNMMERMDLKRGDDMDDSCYKVGDLGHVASLYEGELSPEEGDCRYMAPEMLMMNLNRSQLHKADIFSLGLSVYEAASLKTLPKNSFDDPAYEMIRDGKLPYLDMYSRQFNSFLSTMVISDHSLRPSSSTLVRHSFLQKKHSNTSIAKEIQLAKRRLDELLGMVKRKVVGDSE